MRAAHPGRFRPRRIRPGRLRHRLIPRGERETLAFLLIAALGLLWLFVHRNGDLLGLASLTKRASLVVAFALQQLLMYVIAEATSVGHHFTTRSVVIAWAAIVLILTWALSRDLYQLGVGVVRSVRGGVVVRRSGP